MSIFFHPLQNMSHSPKQTPVFIEKVTSLAEIRECPASGTKSLHARTDLVPGRIFAKFKAKETLTQPSYLSVQIGDNQHILLDPEWLNYTNHNCNPNIFFDTTLQEITVLQSIKPGEEITFFYPSTEWSMQQAFDCLCNSQNCLGCISGAAHLPLDILLKYKLSEFIQQKIAQRSLSLE